MADPVLKVPLQFRFGPFELDTRTGELRNGKVRLKLGGHSSQILLMLLDQPGEAIRREDIKARLWPTDTNVEFDHGINAAVRQLRAVLNDSAEKPRYIETVARIGYRFVGEVEKIATVKPVTTNVVAMPRVKEAKPAETVRPGLYLLEKISPRLSGTSWFVATVAVLSFVILAIFYVRAPNATPPETRTDIVTPATSTPGSFSLSPDGTKIAYVASTDNVSRLWVRSLNSTSAQPLPGTEGARYPFWSPDGRSLGFFAGPSLTRIDLGGGQPQVLDKQVGTGASRASWGPRGEILFSSSGTSPLFRISAYGGQRSRVTKLAQGQSNGHRGPRFLPDGRHFLYTGVNEESGIWLGSLDGAEPRRIVDSTPNTDSSAEFLESGWLIRVRQGNLIAQRFDAASGQLSGEPQVVATGVGVDPVTSAGAFSISQTGMIAWRVGAGGAPRQLLWFTRDGRNVGALGPPDSSGLYSPEISPDGRRVAFVRGPVGTTGDIWIQEGTRTNRFTFDPRDERNGTWSPDGTQVVFASTRNGKFDLYRKPASGLGEEELLLQTESAKRPNSWSPDGRSLLFAIDGGGPKQGLYVLPMTGDRKPVPFVVNGFEVGQGVFSPDGKWVAYQSNETGQAEVYVRPFPGPGGLWQVSESGGAAPRWRVDGKELYYLTRDRKMMALPITADGPKLSPGKPGVLFQTRVFLAGSRQQYDVAPDGRFLINSEVEVASIEPIHLLQSWKLPAR